MAVNLSIYQCVELEKNEFFIFCRLKKYDFNFIIGICYRSPLANFSNFINSMNLAMMRIQNKFPTK